MLLVVFCSYTWPPGNFFSEEFVLRSLIASPLIKPLFAWWVARGIVCILKGLGRLEVSFDVEDSFFQ